MVNKKLQLVAWMNPVSVQWAECLSLVCILLNYSAEGLSLQQPLCQITHLNTDTEVKVPARTFSGVLLTLAWTVPMLSSAGRCPSKNWRNFETKKINEFNLQVTGERRGLLRIRTRTCHFLTTPSTSARSRQPRRIKGKQSNCNKYSRYSTKTVLLRF